MKWIIAAALAATVLVSSAQAAEQKDARSVAFMQRGCISFFTKQSDFNFSDGYCAGIVETIVEYETGFKQSCYTKNESRFDGMKAIVFQALADSKETDNMLVALINASRKLYPCPSK